MKFENFIKGLAAIVGLLGFVFGVHKFLETQAVAAKLPYLEKKLSWCERAVETTAKIATSSEPSQKDLQDFWQMYWGVMGLIEKESITTAMVNYGKAIKSLPPVEQDSKDLTSHLAGLQGKSLELAHACRKELSAEWSPSWSIGR